MRTALDAYPGVAFTAHTPVVRFNVRRCQIASLVGETIAVSIAQKQSCSATLDGISSQIESNRVCKSAVASPSSLDQNG